jgi:hypothetical protein
MILMRCAGNYLRLVFPKFFSCLHKKRNIFTIATAVTLFHRLAAPQSAAPWSNKPNEIVPCFRS